MNRIPTGGQVPCTNPTCPHKTHRAKSAAHLQCVRSMQGRGSSGVAVSGSHLPPPAIAPGAIKTERQVIDGVTAFYPGAEPKEGSLLHGMTPEEVSSFIAENASLTDSPTGFTAAQCFQRDRKDFLADIRSTAERNVVYDFLSKIDRRRGHLHISTRGHLSVFVATPDGELTEEGVALAEIFSAGNGRLGKGLEYKAQKEETRIIGEEIEDKFTPQQISELSLYAPTDGSKTKWAFLADIFRQHCTKDGRINVERVLKQYRPKDDSYGAATAQKEAQAKYAGGDRSATERQLYFLSNLIEAKRYIATDYAVDEDGRRERLNSYLSKDEPIASSSWEPYRQALSDYQDAMGESDPRAVKEKVKEKRRELIGEWFEKEYWPRYVKAVLEAKEIISLEGNLRQLSKGQASSAIDLLSNFHFKVASSD